MSRPVLCGGGRRRPPSLRAVALLALLAETTLAATFVLAPDDVTLRAATAIVVATAESSHCRRITSIETVTTMRVEEVIRGEVPDTFDLVEPGGVVGDLGLAIPGSPRFAAGERVLLLLVRNDRGEWTAQDLAAGVFRFRGELLLRDEEELCGFDRDGRPHREPHRLAAPFLRYVREVARGTSPAVDYVAESSPRSIRSDAGPAASTYLLDNGNALRGRWSTFPSAVSFRSNGTQPGAPNGGLDAVQRGMQVWTDDGGSNIVYQYVGTTSVSRFSGDGVNAILFNDPSGDIPGSFNGQGVLAQGGYFYDLSRSHSFAGEQFYTILEGDLVVQNGISGAGLTGPGFQHVIAHELGHTLGFRHSDEPPPGGTSTSLALMNSTVDFHNDRTGAALQAWDREAAAAVYGAGPSCVAPSITQQPKSIDLPSAQPITLSVAASGDPPLTFQWYVGARGDTRFPLPDGRQASVSVAPSVTTSYWVRVSSGCSPPADSETATITIAGCPAVQFTSVSSGETILEGRSVTLTARASGGTIRYEWFEGGLVIQGASGESIVVAPKRTTTYLARATNSCGATADSATITIEVTPCDAPRIRVQPAGGEVVPGESAALYADVTGSEPLQLQWYMGTPGDTRSPVANAAAESVETGPLFAPASFWVRATNPCGTIDSAAAAIALASSCRAPQIVVQPRVVDGLIRVDATGTGLRYRWYQGPVFDFTKPVGGSGPAIAADAPGEYWVRIENSCGSVNSTSVRAVQARRRAVRR